MKNHLRTYNYTCFETVGGQFHVMDKPDGKIDVTF